MNLCGVNQMAKATIRCTKTGAPVIVNIELPVTALEELGKAARQTHTLENCPACGQSHKWTTADISAPTAN